MPTKNQEIENAPITNSKPNPLLLILSVLLFLTLFALAVVIILPSPKKTDSSSEENKKVTQKPTTENWKTYENEKYEFKYPDTWEMKTETSKENPQLVIITSDIQSSLLSPAPAKYSFHFEYLSIPPGKEPLEMLFYPFPVPQDMAPKISVSDGTINSYKTYKFFNIPDLWGQYTVLVESLDKLNYVKFTLSPVKPVNIGAPDKNQNAALDLFDQILSTFKFTEKSTEEPEVSEPISNSTVKSPITIKGKVPAGWMFEGQFPIKLTDSNKKVIVSGVAKEVTPGSWLASPSGGQSGNAVDFSATLTFETEEKSGFLILENDNPSGDPSKSKTFEVPISFE